MTSSLRTEELAKQLAADLEGKAVSLADRLREIHQPSGDPRPSAGELYSKVVPLNSDEYEPAPTIQIVDIRLSDAAWQRTADIARRNALEFMSAGAWARWRAGHPGGAKKADLLMMHDPEGERRRIGAASL